MADVAFVDTNVLVYAHDASEAARQPTAQAVLAELWRTGLGALSTQVLQELYVSLRKARKPMPAAEARQVVADYLRWEVVVNNGDSVVEAAELETRYRISFWDALIVQAASTSGVEILYSEDLSAGQAYGSVRVVNPLIA